MVIRGRDRYEVLSYEGGPRPGPPVRFGEYVVPAAVAWVLEPVGRNPAVRAEFVMGRDGPECISVSITSAARGRPVTTADLAALPGLDRKGTDAFKAYASRAFDDDAWREGRNLDRIAAVYDVRARDVGEAMRGRSDDELAAVAEVYRAHIDDAPVEAVVSTFGYSRSTADRRIRAARKRGFLPKTSQGKRKA